MNQVIAISIGAMLGANARYWLGLWITQSVASRFPWGTFTVNVLGSFLLGLIVAFQLVRNPLPTNLGLLLGVGFMGSFTTFSTFSVETWLLIQEGHWLMALLYSLGSLVAGLAGVWLGSQVTQLL